MSLILLTVELLLKMMTYKTKIFRRMDNLTGGSGSCNKIHLLIASKTIAGCSNTSDFTGTAVSGECRLDRSYRTAAGYRCDRFKISAQRRRSGN